MQESGEIWTQDPKPGLKGRVTGTLFKGDMRGSVYTRQRAKALSPLPLPHMAVYGKQRRGDHGRTLRAGGGWRGLGPRAGRTAPRAPGRLTGPPGGGGRPGSHVSRPSSAADGGRSGTGASRGARSTPTPGREGGPASGPSLFHRPDAPLAYPETQNATKLKIRLPK